MGKSMIIEAQDSSLVYEEGQKGVLGKLSGVFANFRVGTRNGGRLYNEELVDKRIFGNEDVMEALETRTLFGELDHPVGDRCETLAQNAAVSIIKLEKDADEGVVKGEALILDTPAGRTLKALVDSGAQMGISSRGIGEEIIQEGQTIIDPDTYDFITFDIVVTPANKGARLSLVEGKQQNSKLYKSIEKEVNLCTSLNQLDQLKSVTESAIKVGKGKLMKLIESKITTLNSDENITEVSEDINKGNEDIIPQKAEVKTEAKVTESDEKSKLEEQKLANKELQTASTKLLNENKSLLEKVEQLEKSNKLLQAKLTESRRSEKKANQDRVKFESVHKKNIQRLKKMSESKVSKLEETIKSNENTIKSLNETIEVEKGKYTRLLEANKNLGDIALKNKSKLEENVKLEKENKELKTQLLESKKLLEQSEKRNQVKLEESKKASILELTKLRNQLQEANNKIEESNQTVSKLEEANQRISKLPFNMTSANLKFEGKVPQTNLGNEDMDLFNAMVSMNKK
ncbi:hypothetical protein [uncultured Clostridium sp.]|uniref:hypothetical protein n=1 Tax=uncultured Clostridium sp. TaxID=59620 RepID=UPI0026EF3F6F|nr:hypothetical protein [uncultured Clostridium sp.]